jgi:hypothetical protein
MNDEKLMADVIYTEYELMPAWQRRSAYWVIAPDMLARLQSLFPPRPGPLAQPGEPGWGSPPHLLCMPVEIRDGVEGIHLEVAG